MIPLSSLGATYYPPPITPADVPSVAGWWDASDLSTITSEEGLVLTWSDKSGNGWDVDQLGYPTRRPALGINFVNGLNTITFNPINADGKNLSGSSGSPLPQPYTTMFCGRMAYPSIGRITMSFGAARGYALYHRHADGWYAYNGFAGKLNSPTPEPGKNYIAIGGMSGADSYGRINGVQTSFLNSPGENGGLGTVHIGNYIQTAISGNAFNGDMFEVAFFSGLLTGEQLAGLELYLKTKWGV